MNASVDVMPVPALDVDERRLWWLRLVLGVAALGIGIAALVWPEATVRVVGTLFGLDLLITGLVRAGLSLVVGGYPMLYRVIAVVFGVLTALVGIACLRNVVGSALLLVLFVGIGWLLQGLVDIVLGVAAGTGAVRSFRITGGLASLLGGIAVLVWPGLGLTTFLAFGAVILMVVGIAHIVGAASLLRSGRTGPA